MQLTQSSGALKTALNNAGWVTVTGVYTVDGVKALCITEKPNEVAVEIKNKDTQAADFVVDTYEVTVYNTKPEIKTTATEANTGTSVMTYSETVTIADEVYYEGLIPGKIYCVYALDCTIYVLLVHQSIFLIDENKTCDTLNCNITPAGFFLSSILIKEGIVDFINHGNRSYTALCFGFRDMVRTANCGFP